MNITLKLKSCELKANHATCPNTEELKVLPDLLTIDNTLDIRKTFLKIQMAKKLVRSVEICNLKSKVERILGDDCTLKSILDFIKGVMDDVIVSELFPVAIELRSIVGLPDDIWEKYNVDDMNVNNMQELLELSEKQELDQECVKFLELTLEKCKVVISGCSELKEFLEREG